VFGTSCAGCHASGVDPETGVFAAVSLDGFVCHGDVTLEHTNDPARVHLSPRRDDDPLMVVSICGQCHLRGGRSRSTGRPWPSGFVAGDALFDDFEFDFSEEALAALSIADRHVAENVRDVALRGRTAVTCLSCHSIHGESSRGHRHVEETDLCFTCHARGERRSQRVPMTRSSPVCDDNEGA
jgi:predicted CXXCH cytochrome family protein